MTPAETVIDTFGSIRATARVLNVAPSSVMRWLRYCDKGGKTGQIPRKHFEQLLRAAHAEGKNLTTDHLVFGRNVRSTVIRAGVRPVDPFWFIANSLA